MNQTAIRNELWLLRLIDIKKLPEYKRLQVPRKSTLKKTQLIQAIVQYRLSPMQQRPSQQFIQLKEYTVSQLKKLPEYKKLQIHNKSKLKKAEIIEAIINYRRRAQQQQQPLQQTQSVRQQPSQRRRRQQLQLWNTKECKDMEQKCPMDSNFLGDTWCEQPKKDVVRTADYKFCFNQAELLRMTHTSFTATDTSYQIPPLRLQLPRDQYRKLIPKSIFLDIKKNILETRRPDLEDILLDYVELTYFLSYIDEFYHVFDKPRYINNTVTPAQLSRDLENWFTKHKNMLGGLKYARSPDRSISWNYKQQGDIIIHH